MGAKFFNPSGAPGQIPIGCVVAWLKSFPNCPALSSNFVECNGQTLNDAGSVFNTKTIPDLNGNSNPNRYLRGATTSGATGGTVCHSHTACGTLCTSVGAFNTSGGSVCALTGAAIGFIFVNSATVEPPYYTVTWIMRVK